MAKHVSEIRIEMVINGHRRVVAFLKPEKISEQLDDPGSYGDFLRAIRDEESPGRKTRE